MTDLDRVHNILQYALGVASQNDDWRSRELGPIHLIKYLYVADLAHAEAHNGETYTGIPWRFHKFGPWSEEAYHELEPALLSVNAEKKSIQGKFEDDFIRWRNLDPDLPDVLMKALNVHVALAVRDAVRNFGADTEDLLHHVYQTEPMLNACPGEILDFTSAKAIKPKSEESSGGSSQLLSEGQKKRQKQRIARVQGKLKKRLELKRQKQAEKQFRSEQPAPRYDDVYWEGVAWLDSISGEDIKEESFTASISSELWKSKARYDPDLSS
jgi:hypothetical protein